MPSHSHRLTKSQTLCVPSAVRPVYYPYRTSDLAGSAWTPALYNGGREEYRSGGRERAGFTPPAQLLVGSNAVQRGRDNGPFAPHLYSSVHVGDLFVRNMGPERDRPGFLICPACGRLLDPDDQGRHTFSSQRTPAQGVWKRTESWGHVPQLVGVRQQDRPRSQVQLRGHIAWRSTCRHSWTPRSWSHPGERSGTRLAH